VVFDEEEERGLRQHVPAAVLSWAWRSGWTATVAAGAVFDGELTRGGQAVDLGPGGVVSAALEWLALPGRSPAPFVSLSAAFSVAYTDGEERSTKRSGSLLATDLRLGVRSGWTLWDLWTPYAAVRVFGGPVILQLGDETTDGADQHHYQAAAGISVRVAPFSLFAEGAFLGERGASGGLGYSF